MFLPVFGAGHWQGELAVGMTLTPDGAGGLLAWVARSTPREGPADAGLFLVCAAKSAPLMAAGLIIPTLAPETRQRPLVGHFRALCGTRHYCAVTFLLPEALPNRQILGISTLLGASN